MIGLLKLEVSVFKMPLRGVAWMRFALLFYHADKVANNDGYVKLQRPRAA
jgi:hypothetical protein